MFVEGGAQIVPVQASDLLLSLDINDLDFEAWTERQEMWTKVHGRTKSYPYIHRNEHHSESLFYEEVMKQAEELRKFAEPAFSGGTYVFNALIARLDEGDHIKKHYDPRALRLYTRRFHLPLVTNPGVIFEFDDVPIHLAKGNWWEISTAQQHSVVNSGAARYHLIVDITGNIPL